MADWLIYGANGYTGRLIVEEAIARGHRPILAGRSIDKVSAVARQHGLEAFGVDLKDEAALRGLLHKKALVLHCAGPFVETSAPMVAACIAEGVSYLDITGEISVFQSIFRRDDAAKIAGIALMPGVGFDVVPTDCLAKHVAEKVPHAKTLEIALAGASAISAGTAKSMLLSAGHGGWVRRGGALEPFPFGKGVRRQRFMDRERSVMPIPWGDLETAYRSTGIPDITTYFAVPRRAGRAFDLGWPVLKATQPLMRFALESRVLRDRAVPLIEQRVQGPTEQQRRDGKATIWARAADASGHAAEAWLETLEPYAFTAVAAVRAAERVMAEKPTGALTPSQAFGADFVLELRGSNRKDAL